MTANTLGDFIKEKRFELDMTQEELSAQSNIDNVSILLFEAGEMTPTMLQIYKLAKTLKVAPAFIMRISLDDERNKEESVSNKTVDNQHINQYEDLLETFDVSNVLGVEKMVKAINLSKLINSFDDDVLYTIDETNTLFSKDSFVSSLKMYEYSYGVINNTRMEVIEHAN